MSWIDALENKYQAIQDAKNREIELISISNYWASLTRQLEKDVAEINERLGDLIGRPVSFEQKGMVYVIQYGNNDVSVTISVSNGGHTVLRDVRTVHFGDNHLGETIKTVYRVEARKEDVTLYTNETFYIVPGQASEAILRPIVDVFSAMMRTNK
jgi:hypothetical protein